MEQLSTDKKMNQMVFWPAIIALAAFIFYGVFFQESLGKLLNSLLYGMANGLGVDTRELGQQQDGDHGDDRAAANEHTPSAGACGGRHPVRVGLDVAVEGHEASSRH